MSQKLTCLAVFYYDSTAHLWLVCKADVSNHMLLTTESNELLSPLDVYSCFLLAVVELYMYICTVYLFG